MDTLLITADQLILRGKVSRFCPYKDLCNHHQNPVIIDKSVTMGGLFMGAILPRIDFWMALTNEYYLDKVIKHMMDHKASNKINEIVVGFYALSDTFDNSKTEFIDKGSKVIWKKIRPKGTVKYRTEFQMVSDVTGRVKGKKERYAIDFCKPSDYKNAKIEIVNDFMLYKNDYTSFNKDGSRKKDRCLDHKGVNLGTYNPTVFEVIKAIAYEITFHGTPEDTAKRMEKIEGDVDDYKDGKAGTKEIIFQ